MWTLGSWCCVRVRGESGVAAQGLALVVAVVGAEAAQGRVLAGAAQRVREQVGDVVEQGGGGVEVALEGATVGEVLQVDLPRPRNRVQLAEDPRYVQCRKAVIDFLYTRQAHVEKAA